MTTFSTGREAEAAAAHYLSRQGFKIIDQNWRTRYCEIDIVAQRNKTIYFIEVKYRKSPDWGSGLEYITASKQKQMTFAAEMWVSDCRWKGDYSLGALEVTGPEFEITDFIPDV